MQAIITDKDIRRFMRDLPGLNTLIEGVEFSAEDIQQGQIDTVDRFNILSPPLNIYYTVENFPFRHLMLLGCASFLLRSESFRQAVNQLDYSVEGVQIQDKNKSPLFTTLADKLDEQFERLAQQIRVNINIAGIYGYMPSEYIYRPQF